MKWKYFGYGIFVCCIVALAARQYQNKSDGKKIASEISTTSKKPKEEVVFVPLKYAAISKGVQEQFIGKAVLVNEGIILRGTKENIDDFKTVLELADTSPQEYLIDVLLLSVDTTDTNKTGMSILIDTLRKQDSQLVFTIDPNGSLLIRNSVAEILATIENGKSKVKVQGRSQLSVLAGDSSTINSGERRAVIDQTTQASGQVSTSYKYVDIGLSLTVDILPGSTDKAAALRIQQSSDSVVGFSTIARDEIPIISQRNLKTSVRVDVGETVVLGGLTQENVQKTISGVPFLSSLPFLGKLFSSSSFNKSKSDLIIVLQPVINRFDRSVSTKKEYLNYRKLEADF